MAADPAVVFFPTPVAFRKWLQKNHATKNQLWVGFYRKDSGLPSITWPESVDEALCVGWIDGIRKRIDEKSYKIRFTPRQKTSNWSSINIARVADLTRQQRMKPAGLQAFKNRIAARSGVYAYENRKSATLDPVTERKFRAARAAWEFFQAQAPSYRSTIIWWLTTAKREETRRARLQRLIEFSAAGKRL